VHARDGRHASAHRSAADVVADVGGRAVVRVADDERRQEAHEEEAVGAHFDNGVRVSRDENNNVERGRKHKTRAFANNAHVFQSTCQVSPLPRTPRSEARNGEIFLVERNV